MADLRDARPVPEAVLWPQAELRCTSYYPFVEPGAVVDIAASSAVGRGAACAAICRGWLKCQRRDGASERLPRGRLTGAGRDSRSAPAWSSSSCSATALLISATSSATTSASGSILSRVTELAQRLGRSHGSPEDSPAARHAGASVESGVGAVVHRFRGRPRGGEGSASQRGPSEPLLGRHRRPGQALDRVRRSERGGGAEGRHRADRKPAARWDEASKIQDPRRRVRGDGLLGAGAWIERLVEGIWVLPGDPPIYYRSRRLAGSDPVLDVEITSNRSDCADVIGLAGIAAARGGRSNRRSRSTTGSGAAAGQHRKRRRLPRYMARVVRSSPVARLASRRSRRLRSIQQRRRRAFVASAKHGRPSALTSDRRLDPGAARRRKSSLLDSRVMTLDRTPRVADR